MDLEWKEIVDHLWRIGLAYTLAFPLGWNREHSATRTAGLRTFPLVAMASCGFVLVGLSVLEGSESHARILYGLMTGIGFIGGGAILKREGEISGTATAASIWSTGAIGAAVAWNRLEIAIVLSLVSYLTFRLMKPLKEKEDS